MSKILCSTGALLTYGGDYKLLESLSKELLCDGYEFMMDSPYYDDVEELKSYFQEIKLYIPVVHCEESIGAGKIVIHLWDGRTSDSNFQNNVIGYAHLNKIANEYGLDLLVENVVCNVENPMKHFCELRDKYPEIHFVFDTKMAAFHEQLDLLYEAEYDWLWKEGHICHYHVNDYAGGYMDWENLRSLPIGKGKLDFEHFFDFEKKVGYKGDFTVEATAVDSNGVVDVEMLNEQFRYIKSKLEIL